MVAVPQRGLKICCGKINKEVYSRKRGLHLFWFVSSEKMLRTFRYPLKPTKDQELILESWLLHCRVLYNAALEERRSYYKKYGKGVTRYDQQKSLTEIRKDPEYAVIPSVVARSALDRLDKAFKSFFRRVKAGETPGYPRFKSRDRYDSFGLMSQLPRIENSKINLPKLGFVRFHEYRPLQGAVRDVLVKREAKGWFIYFQCDLGEAPIKRVDETRSVGIDLGLKEFAVLSTGDSIVNPRFGRDAANELARRQRTLARRKRGSKSRARAKVLVTKTYLRVKNQRLDFCRKVAKSLFTRYDIVIHENLQIKNMVRGTLAKSINDAAWNTFLSCLANKAEEAGKLTIGVDPRGTSQECSQCQAKVPKGLGQRTHSCPHCELTLDRDHNAAINIQLRGHFALSRQALAGCS